MVFRVTDTYQVEGDVLSEQNIILTSATSRKDYPGKVRRIRFLDSISGKEYVFLTNNFTWKAQTVADNYKERWHIEVFFRQVKQPEDQILCRHFRERCTDPDMDRPDVDPGIEIPQG